MKHKRQWQRVDLQVSLITAGIVILSFFAVYFFNYYMTYSDMINGLEERANSIYTYVQDTLDFTTFYEIETADDISKESYQLMKDHLADARELTGVMYLYTAKKNTNGDYIYLVDGLPSDSSDFRNPGDLIEEDVVPEMEKAYQGEIVLPDDIKHTSWGNIFVSYYPIRNDGQVIGVIGVEFVAEHQYRTFQIVRWGTPVIAFFACLIAVFIAVRAFKRISNPTHQDMYNTDFLTNLKNRNAFETDMKNIEQRKQYQEMAMIVADLNGLKKVNDEQGHQIGDAYIKQAAQILKGSVEEYPIYRIGGDEFIIIMTHADDAKMKALLAHIQNGIDAANQTTHMNVSMSIGYAIYDASKDSCFKDTYYRGDNQMYAQKRISKNKDRSE